MWALRYEVVPFTKLVFYGKQISWPQPQGSRPSCQQARRNIVAAQMLLQHSGAAS